MTYKFNYVSISDIHLGHRRTSTEEIINKLRHEFKDNAFFAKLDAFFIGGDLFDLLLMYDDVNIKIIEMWMIDLLRLCKKHNVLLRVLEGTPSHDRSQSAHFVFLNDVLEIGCDFRYVDKLEIEIIRDLGVSVLYVPDEWKPDTDDIWLDVTKELANNGLEQVDYAIMHGSFRHQLPEVAKAPKHVEERYLSIVKRVINIGHIHRASQWDRIYSNGSFDRLDHGYETPKGYWLIESLGDVDKVTFIENKQAKIYRTIDCRGIPLEEALHKVEYVNNQDTPLGSHIRILAYKDDAILSSMSIIRQKFCGYTWTQKHEDINRKKQLEDQTSMGNRFVPLSIDSNNVVSIIERRMKEKNVDPVIANTALTLLEAGRHL